MPPIAHSILGASSSHRWLNCPGSVRLSRGIPRQTSAYADEGTAAHNLAETCLRKGRNAVEYLGASLDVDGTAWEVTDEMAEAVQVYLDAIRADMAATPGASLAIERRFDLDWLYPGLFGTNDASLGEAFGLLRIYDYKHGAGVPVEVENNSQLLYYALGGAHGEDYEEVELVVIQPRARHPLGPVRRWRISHNALLNWGRHVLLPGAQATEAEDAPLKHGDHCRWCPASAICPEIRKQAMAAARVAFDDKALPVVSRPVLPDPASLSPDELRRVLDLSDVMSQWIAAVCGYAKGLLERGQPVPGYKLVAGRASRKWIDDKKAEGRLVSLLQKDAYKMDLISVAQAEKALKAKGLDPKAALDDLVAVSRGVSMVPEYDKREALPLKSAAEVFAQEEF